MRDVSAHLTSVFLPDSVKRVFSGLPRQHSQVVGSEVLDNKSILTLLPLDPTDPFPNILSRQPYFSTPFSMGHDHSQAFRN